MYEPFDGKIQQQGWWNHDGLKFKGNLIKPKSLIDVLNKRPRILYYKKSKRCAYLIRDKEYYSIHVKKLDS